MTVAEMLRAMRGTSVRPTVPPGALLLMPHEADKLIALCERIDLGSHCGVCGMRLPKHWGDCEFAALEAALKGEKP